MNYRVINIQESVEAKENRSIPLGKTELQEDGHRTAPIVFSIAAPSAMVLPIPTHLRLSVIRALGTVSDQ